MISYILVNKKSTVFFYLHPEFTVKISNHNLSFNWTECCAFDLIRGMWKIPNNEQMNPQGYKFMWWNWNVMMASPHIWIRRENDVLHIYDDAENEICKRYVQCMQSRDSTHQLHTFHSSNTGNVSSSQGYDDHFSCFDTFCNACMVFEYTASWEPRLEARLPSESNAYAGKVKTMWIFKGNIK